MLVAIYGGSFNPLHFGHTGLASWVASHTEVDEVWLMVTPNNPLKASNILADEQVRLLAARREIERLKQKFLHGEKWDGEQRLDEGILHVQVSDFELGLPRPSYTANTLRELVKAFPEHRFALVIGQDNWNIRRQWREWDTIQERFPIYVYPRGTQGMDAIRQEIKELKADIHLLENAPLFDISSTQLREMKTKTINLKL